MNHLGARLEMRGELLEHDRVAVEDRDIGMNADGHLRCVEADDAATDDDDLRRSNARHAAEQHTAPAMRLLKRRGTGLNRHATGDLAHRLQQRQAAGLVGHGLIGDAGRAGGNEILGLLGIGREMEVGVEDLAGTEHLALERLRFLHLNDHVGLGENLLGVADDFRTGGAIGVVRSGDAGTRLRLDQHLVTVMHGLGHALRRQADTVFVVLHFLGNADQHGSLLANSMERKYPFH